MNPIPLREGGAVVEGSAILVLEAPTDKDPDKAFLQGLSYRCYGGLYKAHVRDLYVSSYGF